MFQVWTINIKTTRFIRANKSKCFRRRKSSWNKKWKIRRNNWTTSYKHSKWRRSKLTCYWKKSIELTKQPVIVSPTEENLIELVVEKQLDLQEHPNINVPAEENVAEA